MRGCDGSSAGFAVALRTAVPARRHHRRRQATFRVGTDDNALPVLLVVADPGSGSSVDRASVRVTADTIVWTADGVRGAAADLAAGAQVAVWFTGPVAESYPVQATAGVIQILTPL